MRLWQQSMIFLARNESVKNFMQRRATMSLLAKRFVGGESVIDVTEIATHLKSDDKKTASLFYLGEYVEDFNVVQQTVTELKSIINQLAQANLDVHISVDPTQIGFQIDAKLCNQNALDLANEISRCTNDKGQPGRHYLMIDMEDSSVMQATIDLHAELQEKQLPVALTMQAYLHSTEKDLAKIIQNGGAVRLVKGAFSEGKHLAYTSRADIDNNFLKLADLMLSAEAHQNGFYPVFGTHDDRIIRKIIKIADDRKWKKEEYEFEMLYGVRNNYQTELVHSGEQLRLYLPFGTDWWPYAVRRVGESPKNGLFLAKSIFSK